MTLAHARNAATTVALVVAIAGLSGCSPRSMESPVLESAARLASFDATARAFCEEYIGGHPLVAVVDSTAGEIRTIAAQVETRGSWDRGLPPSPDDYVAICILDVEGVSGIQDGLSYMAYWGIPSASELLTAW